MAITPTYANSSNQIAALKELYKDPSEVLKDMVYQPIRFTGTFIR